MQRFHLLLEEARGWRRDFHRHPELGMATHRTSARVAELLRSFGVDDVTEGVGETGVVAVIEGAQGAGRTLGFRADMDALPMQEVTGVPHSSTHPGAMHACGHDGHTAILLATAKELARSRAFAGRVVLIFQPGEEGAGGARAMLADGLLERWSIEELYGLHTMPKLPVGHFATRPGPLLAATDFFDLEVRGQGAHAAMPHTGTDATLAAAAIVQAASSIVARNIPALESAVLSITGFATDSMAHNVMPDAVKLTGTIRTLDEGVRDLVVARLRTLVEGVAAAHGARATLDIHNVAIPTVNAAEPTAVAIAAAKSFAPSVTGAIEPVMGGEDFGDMLAARPGAFVFLGNGDSAALHNPHYDFNDDAIPSGVAWFVSVAEQRLAAR